MFIYFASGVHVFNMIYSTEDINIHLAALQKYSQ